MGLLLANVLSVSFTPTDIAGLVSWYDAQDLATITKDGSNNVSQWDDKGSGGVNVTSSGSTRPVYTATGNINSYPSVLFDGTDDTMDATAKPFTSIDQYTFFSVIRATVLSGYRTLLGIGGSGDEFGHYVIGNSFGLYASGVYSPGGTPLSTATNYYLCVRKDATPEIKFRVNASDVGSPIAGPGNITPAAVLGVGANGSSECFSGDIGEILLYDSLLSPGDITSVETYLASKWGI